jgi:hypothetical protein
MHIHRIYLQSMHILPERWGLGTANALVLWLCKVVWALLTYCGEVGRQTGEQSPPSSVLSVRIEKVLGHQADRAGEVFVGLTWSRGLE